MDIEQFEERAAIAEYDGGLTRFQAETLAARAQEMERWEALHEIAKRVVERVGDKRQAMAGQSRQDDMPAMQRGPEGEKSERRVSERDGYGRGGADPLPSLRTQRGGKL